jgi:HEAT repeat protein
MSCDAVRRLIPLYYYGELTPEEEDRVEGHIFECAACARATERQRALAAALDRREAELPPMLLDDCRAELMLAIQGGTPILKTPAKRPWTRFLEAMADTLSGVGRFRRPLTAMALVALGFFSARVPGWRGASVSSISLAPDQAFATVRSVLADNSGRVQIAYDETERRSISGPIDDRNIRRLLVAGSRDENPDVRVQAVDLLKARAASADVREVLLNRLANDPNAGVRLKALEGLKPLAFEPEVRKTLAQALLADDNPAVRMQAVDLLIAHRDDSMVGVLQGLVQREDNNNVRLRCEKALMEMNASVGTF